jgi:short-subunit dehydrogenase
LAAKGAKVYFTARTEVKAKKTQDELIALSPKLTPEDLPWVLIDFDKIEMAASAAAEIRAKEDKVDILGTDQPNTS